MNKGLIEWLHYAAKTTRLDADAALFKEAADEIERLQTERVILNACSNTAAVLEMHSRIATLEAENAGLRRDAERYRLAIAYEDNAGLLYEAVINHYPDKASIDAEFDDEAIAVGATSSVPET